MGTKRLNLEKCPLCGSSKVEPSSNIIKTRIGTFETIAQVWCKKCGVNGPPAYGWESELNGTHITLWNSWAKWTPQVIKEQEKSWKL